jgi:hypothetical protein
MSVEVRYCSRCGFHLGGVDALLAQEPAASMPLSVYSSGPSPRRIGTRLGAKLMFLSLVLFPLFIALSVAVDGPVPLLVPLTIFLAGLVRAVYAMLFEEREPSAPPLQQSLPRQGGYAPPLPPHYSAPFASTGGRARSTGEVVQPPSVTEQTTRFLEEK